MFNILDKVIYKYTHKLYLVKNLKTFKIRIRVNTNCNLSKMNFLVNYRGKNSLRSSGHQVSDNEKLKSDLTISSSAKLTPNTSMSQSLARLMFLPRLLPFRQPFFLFRSPLPNYVKIVPLLVEFTLGLRDNKNKVYSNYTFHRNQWVRHAPEVRQRRTAAHVSWNRMPEGWRTFSILE